MKKIILFIMFIFLALPANAYQTFKLDNGHTVIIQENHDNPIVTIDTWVKTGSINETDKNNGVAHFLEHLFFKGTQKYPSGEFEKILEAKGAITNAATSKDFTHYYITIPSKDFDLALCLHADMLLNPLIPAKELEKERKVVLEEIGRDLDSPESQLSDKFMKTFYPTHPYKRTVLGNPKVIETISRENIFAFYNDYYMPSNMITIVVGDINTQDALKKVSAAFIDNKNRTPIVHKFAKDPAPKHFTETKDYKDIQSGYLILGVKTVPINDKRDIYALDLLSTILGGSKSSRLNQDLKEKKQLVYSISAGHSNQKDDGIFYVDADFEPQNYDKIKTEIFNQFNLIKTKPVSNEELIRAKKIIERQTFFSRESNSNIATELGLLTLLDGTPKEYDTYLTSINKVSAADIKRVANKYLIKEKTVLSTVLPKKTEVKVSNIEKTPQAPVKLISTDGNIKKYELSNGATLIFNKNLNNDITAITISAKGGNFLEKIPGTAILTAAVMPQGTKNYTSDAWAQKLEESGIVITPSASAETFDVSLKTAKNDLPLALNLLNEIINNAVFNTSEIEKAKTLKLAAYKKMLDNPLSIAVDTYKGEIYKGSVYGNNSKIYNKTIPTINRNDILNYYQTIFCPKNIIISVNANVDEKVLIENFSNMFHSNNCQKFEIKDLKTPLAQIETPKEIKVTKDSKTLWLLLGFRAPNMLETKDYAALTVLDSILGNGMSSRLFTNLRIDKGLAYQVGSSYSPNVNYGAFIAYIGTNPTNLEAAKRGIFDEIEKVKTQFVSEKELQEAKDKILGNYTIGLETNMQKASTLGWFETTGRGYEYWKTYPKIIQEVNASDVLSVADKYFSQPYFLTIVGP